MTDYEKSLSTLTNEELIDEAYSYMNDMYYEAIHRMIIREMKKRFVKSPDSKKKESYVEIAKNNIKEFNNLVDQLKQQFEGKGKNNMDIKNAKITNTYISMADHGCLTFDLALEGAGWGCNYGGYCIGKGYLGAKEFTANSGNGLVAMMKIMDTVGVEHWEDLKGKYIRCKINGYGGTIDEIGNLIENKWFNIREFFANNKGKQ